MKNLPHKRSKLPTPKRGVQIPAQRGNATAEEIYVAIGRALTAWEHLEEQLAELFTLVTTPWWEKPPTHGAAARAYGSIATFRGRKEMIQNAAEMFCSHPYLFSGIFNRIKSFLRDCESHASRRNEIAHGVVRRITEIRTAIIRQGPFQRDLDGFNVNDFFLLPASYNSMKMEPTPFPAQSPSSDWAVGGEWLERLLLVGPGAFRYDANQISLLAFEFDRLRAEGMRICQDISEAADKFRIKNSGDQSSSD